MRIACLLIPSFPLAAALRAQPALASAPLAITSGEAGRAQVLAASAAARAQGVFAGLTVAEARSRCPQLVVRPSSPEQERAAAQAAVEAACAISPRVEPVAADRIDLDAEGLSSLFGDERGVAQALLVAAERVGLCGAVGLAEGRTAALLAARATAAQVEPHLGPRGLTGGACIAVPQAQQRAFLSELPVALAEPSPELAQALARFGIHTLGQLAALPRAALAARAGEEAAQLHRTACGETSAPLTPRPLPQRFEEGEELEWGAGALEPLLFVWKGLLDRLCARLSARGLSAQELWLVLRLSSGAWDERTLALAAPTREVPALLQLLRLEVEARPPGEAVVAVRIGARAAPEQLEQLALFGPRTASPAQLATAVARLAALVGPDRVGQAVPLDGHRAFAVTQTRFAPPPAPLLAALPAAPAGCGADPRPEAAQPLPLCARALRPPRAAEVRCDRAGAPIFVIGEGALGGSVVASAGPWRTQADWWTDQPLQLDSYDLELVGGLLVRASRELASSAWWIEAVYD